MTVSQITVAPLCCSKADNAHQPSALAQIYKLDRIIMRPQVHAAHTGAVVLCCNKAILAGTHGTVDTNTLLRPGGTLGGRQCRARSPGLLCCHLKQPLQSHLGVRLQANEPLDTLTILHRWRV